MLDAVILSDLHLGSHNYEAKRICHLLERLVSGEVTMRLDLRMRFDYGRVVPWMRKVGDQLAGIAGPDSIWLRGTSGGNRRRSAPRSPASRVSIASGQCWTPPDSPWAQGALPIPPGPDNPLGTRWMGISAPNVGIHGTNDPASIGYSVSHGCIRMQIPDAERLFEMVYVGTTVTIRA